MPAVSCRPRNLIGQPLNVLTTDQSLTAAHVSRHLRSSCLTSTQHILNAAKQIADLSLSSLLPFGLSLNPSYLALFKRPLTKVDGK